MGAAVLCILVFVAICAALLPLGFAIALSIAAVGPGWAAIFWIGGSCAVVAVAYQGLLGKRGP